MGLLSEDDKKALQEQFGSITRKINIHFFTSKESDECPLCGETKQILDELAELSESFKIIEYDVNAEPDSKSKFNIEVVPAIVLTLEDNKDLGIRWYGIPAGHEFMTLIGAIIDVGTDKIDIPDWALEKIAEIGKPVDIKVFVTPT
ncbi:MAG: hypothetical protein K8S87_07485 [Planctomycetes bacterium]|nr:hypothetical protein [Planctomycetota bacterium]